MKIKKQDGTIIDIVGDIHFPMNSNEVLFDGEVLGTYKDLQRARMVYSELITINLNGVSYYEMPNE